MSQRTDRLDELLRQEIGAIIAREVADPRIGFVTITDVETTSDLQHAKVFVSVIGSTAERKSALGALGRAMPFIRRELGRRIQIRRIPELHLQADDTLERGTRILQLISELGTGEEPTDLTSGGDDSLPTPVARLPHDGDAPPDPPDPNLPGTERGRPQRRRRGCSGGASPAGGAPQRRRGGRA